MTMTATDERITSWDQVHEREQERAEARRVRRTRTTLLKLPACSVCEGASEGTDDPEVRCICAERTSQLNARLARIVAERRGETLNLGDVIAP